jgi:hypothetical protein
MMKPEQEKDLAAMLRAHIYQVVAVEQSSKDQEGIEGAVF